MADYISVVTPATEINPAPAIRLTEYTMEMAIEAMNTVEEDLDDCMDWVTFGVGGPA
jgi:hypothetical protein